MSMIEIKGLKKSFGDLEVLKNIDQNVEEGEVLCIVGPSGSGKSTMLRCINRLEEPTGGEIYIDGELITEKNVDRIRTKMGMVFQQFNLFPHMSVLDNLTCGPLNVKKADKKEAEKKAMELLTRVGLAEKADQFPRNLSGGQQQRVAIARALMGEPEIILADEPTGNLDKESGENIMELFKKINEEKGMTILQVTHSEKNSEYGSRVVKLDNGKLV